MERSQEIHQSLYIKKDTPKEYKGNLVHWSTIKVWKEVRNEQNTTEEQNEQGKKASFEPDKEVIFFRKFHYQHCKNAEQMW